MFYIDSVINLIVLNKLDLIEINSLYTAKLNFKLSKSYKPINSDRISYYDKQLIKGFWKFLI